MARTLCIAALTLTAALTGAAALAQDKSSGRVPWWRNSKIQHELLLSDGQLPVTRADLSAAVASENCASA